MLRTAIVIFVVLMFIFFLGAPFLVYAVLSGNTDPLYKAGLLAVRSALWVGGVRMEVKGREKIPAGGSLVFMPNHQSNADPPAIFTHLPPVLVIAKKEFFRVPILGRAMKLRGFIPLDRTNRDRSRQAVEQAVRSLKAGNSLLVYPEGTRSPDGRLQAFKKGAFIMAIEAGAPIVPISISGANRIMPKGSRIIRPGRVRITFHAPIPTEGCGLNDRDRIMESVRRSILSGLAPEEQPLEERDVTSPANTR